MKIICILIFAIFPAFVIGTDLKQVRLEYYSAVSNEDVADKLYNKLKKQQSAEPVILAYLGATQAVRAKHAINPYNKLSFLKSGIKTLNTAVAKSPNDLEIRFLRYSLQHYVPGFLGFSKDLVTDKKKMVELIQKKQFGTVDNALLKNIISFLKETKRCTSQEIAILDKAL